MSGRRFKPYPAYRDSDVEWLGEIPAHWDVKKIKRLCLVRRGASPRPIDDPIYFDDEGEYAWVRIADVTASERYLECTTQRLSPLGKSKSVALEPGELFLSIAATVGKPVITRIKCCIHDGFVYFVELHENREFLYFLFSCGEPYKGLGKLGTQLNLNTDTIGDIYLPRPSGAEQETIVLFLDRETARIDTLVAKRERLIELLQEQRTALITRAITKGLDPNVPMKDSGVEWLGEIPAHWEVKLLKRVFANLDSRRIPLSGEERSAMSKEYPYYGASGVIDHVEGYLFDEPLVLVAEDGANLYSRSTPLAFVAEGKFWVNNHAHILRPHDGRVRYWAHVLGSIVFDPWISGSAQPKLTSEKLGSIPLPVPPIHELDDILAVADARSGEIDRLSAKVRDAIDRLKELRTALISAAVTGKIDVREEVA